MSDPQLAFALPPPTIDRATLLSAHPHMLTDMTRAREFMLAGRAHFTLRSRKTGTRFTYKVRAKSDRFDGIVHFVSVLTGIGLECDFEFLAYIKDGQYLYRGRNSRIASNAPSYVALAWFWSLSEIDPSTLEFWHEGRCGRCGRRLTAPESILRGIGPECAKA